MKKVLLPLFLLFSVSHTVLGQCSIDPDIQDNYLTDAWIMVFREFAENPSHPDYDIPILDAQKTIPYLEKLSAIYDRVDTNPVVDSLFNKFAIHASNNHPSDIAFGKIYLEIDEKAPWVQDFIDTGVSGVTALDQLMSTYEFSISSVSIVDPPGTYSIEIDSDIMYLNHFALLDDFVAVQDILSAFPGQGDGTNYNGIPFLVNGEQVVAANIVVIDNVYRFSLHVNFCGTTCEISKGWDVLISKDCSQITIEALEILDVTEFGINTVSIYPNPVSTSLTIEADNISIKSVSVFSTSGRQVYNMRYTGETIDVSFLPSGLYFIECITSEGQKYNHKFLKK